MATEKHSKGSASDRWPSDLVASKDEAAASCPMVGKEATTCDTRVVLANSAAQQIEVLLVELLDADEANCINDEDVIERALISRSRKLAHAVQMLLGDAEDVHGINAAALEVSHG